MSRGVPGSMDEDDCRLRHFGVLGGSVYLICRRSRVAQVYGQSFLRISISLAAHLLVITPPLTHVRLWIFSKIGRMKPCGRPQLC